MNSPNAPGFGPAVNGFSANASEVLSNASNMDPRQIQMALLNEQRRQQQEQHIHNQQDMLLKEEGLRIEAANALNLQGAAPGNWLSPSGNPPALSNSPNDLLSSLLLQTSNHATLQERIQMLQQNKESEDSFRFLLEHRKLEEALRHKRMEELKIQQQLGDIQRQQQASSLLQSQQLQSQLPNLGYFQDRKEPSIFTGGTAGLASIAQAGTLGSWESGDLKRSAEPMEQLWKKPRRSLPMQDFPLPSLEPDLHVTRTNFQLASYKQVWQDLGMLTNQKEAFVRRLVNSKVPISSQTRSVILQHERRRETGNNNIRMIHHGL